MNAFFCKKGRRPAWLRSIVWCWRQFIRSGELKTAAYSYIVTGAIRHNQLLGMQPEKSDTNNHPKNRRPSRKGILGCGFLKISHLGLNTNPKIVSPLLSRNFKYIMSARNLLIRSRRDNYTLPQSFAQHECAPNQKNDNQTNLSQIRGEKIHWKRI